MRNLNTNKQNLIDIWDATPKSLITTAGDATINK